MTPPSKHERPRRLAGTPRASARTGQTTEQQEEPRGRVTPFRRLITDWSALASVAVLLTSLVYVLLNSAYVAFYESLGIRPEDVGLDRLAILARTAGPIVLVALVALPVAYGFFTVRLFVPGKSDSDLGDGRRDHEPVAHHTHDEAQTASPSPNPSRRSTLGRWWREFWAQPVPPRIIVASGIVVLLIFGIRGIQDLNTNMAERAAAVRQGVPTAGVQYRLFPLIDVGADAARVSWLDSVEGRPALFDDPSLLYVGQSDRVAVFVACGRTVVVPADKVATVIIKGRNAATRARGNGADRNAVCKRLTAKQ